MFDRTVLLACVLAGCGDDVSGTVAVPADWQSFPTSCHFSFRAPPDTREIPTQGDDSCVVRFALSDCELSGDYGGFSDTLTSYGDAPEFASETIEVDGKTARLVRFRAGEERRYAAAVHVPHPDDNELVTLTVFASCASSEGQATALTVLKTLAF
jgi:hypothetical protein